jgi:glycerol dehydrogenase-like iron-containing ADH family enzyme
LGGNRLAGQARQQLLGFFRSLALPCDLADLGLLDASLQDLLTVCVHACRDGSDLHHLPFAVDPHDLLAALVNTTSHPVAAG